MRHEFCHCFNCIRESATPCMHIVRPTMQNSALKHREARVGWAQDARAWIVVIVIILVVVFVKFFFDRIKQITAFCHATNHENIIDSPAAKILNERGCLLHNRRHDGVKQLFVSSVGTTKRVPRRSLKPASVNFLALSLRLIFFFSSKN
eukprot:GABV01001683.1.p2 GENE.GABV01001683.1~~GABV01001683.1.p2  ORF type:complete len:149 (-),score=24.93 GABV01001683.1:234-680(-)